MLDGEIAGDLAAAAGDRAEDARRRDHLAVEHDGEQFADVLRRHLAESLPAAQVEAEIDVGLAGARVEARLGVGEVFARHHHPLLHRDRAALHLRQSLDLARRVARIGDEAEFELGGRAEQVLDLGGVLQARHFNDDAVEPLLLDDRLLGARSVEAAVQDFDRLGDRMADLFGRRRLGELELDRAVAVVGDVEGVAGRAGQRAADPLVERAQEFERAGALGGIGDPHHHAARQLARCRR